MEREKERQGDTEREKDREIHRVQKYRERVIHLETERYTDRKRLRDRG